LPLQNRKPLALAVLVAVAILTRLSPDASARFGGNCSKTSTGKVPVNDLGPDLYQGFEGGLYPQGLNQRPAAHEAAGIALAGQVVPLDRNGAASSTGAIGLLSIGMSNASLEWQTFIRTASRDQAIDRSVKIVDGAESGRDARDISNSSSSYWSSTI